MFPCCCSRVSGTFASLRSTHEVTLFFRPCVHTKTQEPLKQFSQPISGTNILSLLQHKILKFIPVQQPLHVPNHQIHHTPYVSYCRSEIIVIISTLVTVLKILNSQKCFVKEIKQNLILLCY